MSQHDTLTLRDALRNIQYEAASLADAQVIALQALNATYPARAALSATQPAQAAQGEPTLRDYAEALIDAGHDFWKACNREAGGGAVRWLSCDDGTLIVFTRVEYRDEIMAHVRGYKAPVVVFDEGSMTALEAEAAQGAGEVVGEIDDAVTLNGCRAGCMNQNLPPGTKLYTQPATGAVVPDMVEIMALADSYRNATCHEATASAREWLRAAIAASGRQE